MPKDETSRRIVLSGYYGFGNTGDEALLAGLLIGIGQVDPQLTPLVLSGNPAYTAALHGVEAVCRNRVTDVRRALSASVALLSGGGSLLQDVTSRRSVYYYLSVMYLARLLGVPFFLYGQGIGPLKGRLARQATRFVLQRSRGIWVRDEASKRALQDLGVTVPDLNVVGDPAFLLGPADVEQARTRLDAETVGGKHRDKPVWVVAARPWAKSSSWMPNLVNALGQAAREAGAVLGFLVMHQGVDTPVARGLASRVSSDYGVGAHVVEPSSFWQAQHFLAGADLVVAMRLHALILAVTGAVPAVAISYDPKVSALASELSLPWLFTQALADSGGADILNEALVTTWCKREIIASRLIDEAQKRRESAIEGLAVALSALRRQGRKERSGTRGAATRD